MSAARAWWRGASAHGGRWLLVILILGGGLRLLTVPRPLDHRIDNPWRQSDYLQLARNFDREGMSPLYPRIDWRRDTPGYAEMELPVLPWLGACLFRLFGPHVQLMRAVAALFTLAALCLFAALARRLLPEPAALFATACYALNPLLLLLAGALQPEPVVELLTLAAVALAWRWYGDPAPRRLLLAAAVAGVAIAAKLPALYLGVLLAYLVLRRQGIAALRDPRVYAAAAAAVVPPAAWYAWAHRFWTVYGNSLGVSNESHFIGLDMLFPPDFLPRLVKLEVVGVLSPFGVLLALAALRLPWRRIELPLAWYGAVWVFYLASARTAGDEWAYYYHALSVAPGALLMGAGLLAWREGKVVPERFRATQWQPRIAVALAALTLAGLVGIAVRKAWHRDRDPFLADYYRCARELAAVVPPDGRIVVRGGRMFDQYGRPVAHNESMAFAWMDRKGFNYGIEELSLATLERLAARGGRYWLARAGEVSGELGETVEARFPRIGECPGKYGFYVYDLGPPHGLHDEM